MDGVRNGAQAGASIVKIVYFDEQSASDYLDITAGGNASTRSEYIRDRSAKTHAEVESKIAAKFSWLPFLGASVETGGGFDVSRVGQSILHKTLSNTILTDYLASVAGDERVKALRGFDVTAPKDSMAFMKMYTPYMVVAKAVEAGLDLARMDEALERAKGYYELLAREPGAVAASCVLRFNIAAFRNNYGLTDLGRMRLVYHGVLVGQTTETSLSVDAEMGGSDTSRDESKTPTAIEIVDGPVDREPAAVKLLDVFDVVLAGVEHG
ncbi:DUF6414 family protein [Aquipuribacter sp. MA13-6]|uniref:DUF6414 family protein n=1 Tax=unclassified Aquipuribacter TaxID=2635084 RepID=UPI003EEF470F